LERRGGGVLSGEAKQRGTLRNPPLENQQDSAEQIQQAGGDGLTDIYVPLATFRRLIKQGKQSGPIFESKETVLTTVGAATVLAGKIRMDKIFTKRNGYDQISLPFKRRGYMSIATITEKALDDEEVLAMLKEEFRDYSVESLEIIRDVVQGLIEEATA